MVSWVVSAIVRPAWITASIGALGDLGAQFVEKSYLVKEDEEMDTARTARLVAFRAVQGPLMAAAWTVFDRRFSFLSPVKRVVAKVVSDQIFLMAPFTFFFFLSQAAMDGTWNLSRALVLFPESLAFQLPYWCVTHTFTFGYVPPKYRVLWFSSAAVFANGYLSFVNERSAREDRALLLDADDETCDKQNIPAAIQRKTTAAIAQAAASAPAVSAM